jgi:NAD(P)-dependent dehydrogenase (short-subunit alcohol dehydrogenase family)
MALIDRFRLDGRTALVTGSSRGIGRALALGLAEQGAAVAIHCAGNIDQAEQVAAEIVAHGGSATALQADLAQADAPGRLYAQASKQLGRIDILALNASIQARQPWQEITRDAFDLQIQVNVRAGLELMQYALPAMIARGWGRILTIGSVQQWRPHPAMPVYAATKSAQVSMVRNLALQVAGSGVTINNLAPGVIRTDRNSVALNDPDYHAQVLAQIPARRIGEAGECVGAALLLCSDAGSYITGADLPVDGGMHL